MRNTYSKLNYHLIFSTKNRIPLIDKSFQDELYGYIGGHSSREWRRAFDRRRHAGPCPSSGRLGDQHLGRQDAPTDQGKFLEVDERASWDGNRPLRLAGRLWSLYRQRVSDCSCPKIHPEPGRAPPEAVVPRGIPHAFEAT